MNKKARINYIHALSSQVERKKMYKAKKQWVVAGISFLVATGMGAIGNHLTTHADTTNAAASKTEKTITPASSSVSSGASAKSSVASSSATSISKPETKVDGIQAQANKMQNRLMLDAGQNLKNLNPKVSNPKPTNSGSNTNFGKSTPATVTKPRVNVGAASQYEAQGTWGTAKWNIDNATKTLTIHDGDIGNNNWQGPYMNPNLDVKHVVFSNVFDTNLPFLNTGGNEQPIFSDYKNSLQTIDLTGFHQVINPKGNGKYSDGARTIGHTFSHLNALQSITFGPYIDTSYVYFMDNMFSDDPNLQQINGFQYLKTDNLQDYDYMFRNDKSLQSLDFSNFDTTHVAKNGQITYNNDSYKGDGNYQAFNGANNLSTIKLGNNSIIYPDSNLKSYILQGGKSSAMQLDDGKAHPGIWTLFNPNQNIKSDGVTWSYDTGNGTLLIHDGTMTSNTKSSNISWANVKHIYTSNVTMPTKIDGLFSGLSNLISLDLSGANLSNVSDMSFGINGDGNLVDVDLGSTSSSKLLNINDMFQGDRKLTTIKGISDLNVSQVGAQSIQTQNNNYQGFWSVFSDDNSLKFLDLSKWIIPTSINHEQDKFLKTPSLSTVKLGSDIHLTDNAGLQGSWININSDSPKSISASDLQDGNIHAGTWTKNAEIIQLENNGTPVYSDVVKGTAGKQDSIGNTPIFVPLEYKLDNPAQAFTYDGGITQVPVHLAISDTVNSASSRVYSDYVKTSALDSANSNDNNYEAGNTNASADLNAMNTDTTSIDNLLNQINSEKSNLASATASNVASDVTNANTDYDDAYKANANIEEIINSEMADLKNSNVTAFLVKSTNSGDSFTPVKAAGTNVNSSIAPNAISVGKFGDSSQTLMNNLLGAIPKGYHIVPQQKLGVRRVNLKTNNTKHGLLLGAENNQSDVSDQVDPDVQVEGNQVTYKPTINLHFHVDNSNNSDVVIELPAKSLTTEVGNHINLLDNKDNGGTSDKTDPTTEFIGNTLKGFNTKGFSLAGFGNKSNPSSDEYSFEVPVNANSSDESNVTISPTLNFYFTANSGYSERVNYVDVNNSNVNAGSTTLSGTNDESYDINSSNVTSLNSGWHLVSNDNKFTFGNKNSDNGTISVSVAPNTIRDTVKYQIASNNVYQHQNSVVSSTSITLNDDRASGAGNLSSTVSTAPSGYNLESNSVVLEHNANSNSDSVSDTIYIKPQSEAETVNYIYNGNKNSPVSTATLSGGYYDNSASVTTLPAGWSFASPANNSFTYGKAGNVDDVNITPASASTTVYYIPSGKAQNSSNAVGSHTFSGNNYQTSTGSYSTSFSNNASSASGLSAGYHIYGNQAVDYGDGSIKYITVIGNDHKGDKTPLPYNPSDSKNKKPNKPTNSDSDIQPSTKPITPDNLKPNTKPYIPAKNDEESNTFYIGINKYVGNNCISSYAKRYTIDGQTGSGFNIDPNAFTPDGYKTTSSDQTVKGTIEANSLYPQSVIFNYDAVDNYNPNDNKEKSNPSAPNTITFTYVYTDSKNNQHTISTDQNAINGITDTQEPYTATAPQGYQLTNGESGQKEYTITAAHHNITISVKPKQNTDNINYVYSDTTLNIDGKSVSIQGTTAGSYQFTGNDSSDADNVSDTTFTIDKNNHKGLENGFVVTGSNTFNYDGGPHQVNVTPYNANIYVIYKNQNKVEVGHQVVKDSVLHNNLVGDTDDLIKQNLLTAPQGYHFDQGASAPVTLDTPFYSKPNHSTLSSAPVTLLTLSLNANSETDTTKLANAKITSDSAAVNSESQSATSMMSNSNISGVTRDSISSASSAISSASIAINKDMNGGSSAESNANTALASASSAYSNASSIASSVASSVSSSAQSSSNASSSASASLSNSAKQMNSDISSANDWINNSSISDNTRSLISNDINTMSADNSSAEQFSGKGVNGSTSAQTYFNSAVSAYNNASSLANSAITSYKTSEQNEANSKASAESASASASSLANLISNDVNNATKNNKPTTVPTSLTSNEVQSLANELSGNIVVKPVIKPNLSETNTTQTVDGSALNSLTSEVAANNNEISSLANKPANSMANTIDYNYFNNLVNSGVSQLTDVLNKDFKADIHNVHANSVKTPVKRVRKHIRWIMIAKPLKLYNKATMVNGKHGVVKVLKPNHKITLDVKEVFRVRNHNVFKVSYHHHNYFIADNHKLVKNSYLPKSYSLVGKRVRVLHDVYAYRHKASDRVKTLHRGFTARIKNVVKVGRYNMTRIQLSNGNWISANKNFVKVL